MATETLTEARSAVQAAMLTAMTQLTERLRAEPTPLPWGKVQHYQSMVPAKSPDEMLATPDAPHLWGYAEAVREFVALLAATPKQPFVEKRKNKS